MLKDPLLVLNILQIMNNMFLCAMECGADHPYTASFNPYNQPHLELLTPTHSIHISVAWWATGSLHLPLLEHLKAGPFFYCRFQCVHHLLKEFFLTILIEDILDMLSYLIHSIYHYWYNTSC